MGWEAVSGGFSKVDKEMMKFTRGRSSQVRLQTGLWGWKFLTEIVKSVAENGSDEEPRAGETSRGPTQTDSSIQISPTFSSLPFYFWRSSNGKKLNNSAALICAHKWEFISIFDPPPLLPFCKSASIKIYLGVQMCWNRLKGNLSALSKHKCRCCEVN